MKNVLLLLATVSGIIYAGGDNALVQSNTLQKSLTGCSFWGSLAFRYDVNKKGKYNFGDSENNVALAALAIGAEKKLGYGFAFGAEMDSLYMLDGSFNKSNGVNPILGETSGLMQAYLSYKTGNSVIKAGRQALPKALSPWAYSERPALGGIAQRTYNGITIINSDIKNMTLAAAWIAGITDFLPNKLGTHNLKINGSNKGLFALSAIYKGISNTTLSSALYYMPKNGTKGKAYSAWAAVESKANSVNFGLQMAYAKADAGSLALLGRPGTKASLGIAAYAGTKLDAFNLKLTLAYLNDGDATLSLSKTGSKPNPGSAFWGATYKVMGENTISGNKQKIARLDMGYTLANKNKIYAGIAVDKPDTGKTAYAARVGYKFKIAGVAAKAEYRYHKGFDGKNDQRFRVQGIYKF